VGIDMRSRTNLA